MEAEIAFQKVIETDDCNFVLFHQYGSVSSCSSEQLTANACFD